MAEELVVRDETEALPPPRSRWGWLRDLAVLVGGAVLVWVGIGWWRAPKLPEIAPDFSLPTLSGSHVSLASERGHPVVLNFFATWCGPCELELPTITDFAANNPDVPVYYLAVDGSAEALKAYALAHQMPLSNVVRLDNPTRDAYKPDTLPTTVVVKADGRIGGAHAGIILRPQLWWMTR